MNIRFSVLVLVLFATKCYCRIEYKDKSIKNRIITDLVSKPPDFHESSIKLAFDHCQESFKWEKWNCPPYSFFEKSSSNVIDREQAFVKALTTASHIYSTFMNCTKKSTNDCDSWIHEDEVLTTYQPRDLLAYANFHNIRAGKMAVRNSFRNLCRCHGMSGSCSIQTCWQTLNSFSVIAAYIKRMYDLSAMIHLDNFGKVYVDHILDDQLVYLIDSPNYCIPNIIPKWKGTKNRKCLKGNHNSVSAVEKNSCKILCKSCGLSVRKYQQKFQRRCNFKFDWQSSITYDLCDDVATEYFCD